MDYERRLVGEAQNLGGLLVAYLFVGLPVGAIPIRLVESVNRPLSLSAIEAGLVLGAVVIAAVEVAGYRPGPVESIGFFAANGAVQIPLVLVALFAESASVMTAANLVAALVAYVLAIRWGAAETARRFRDALGRLTWVPDREDPAQRR